MISIDQVPFELSKAKGKLDDAKSDLLTFEECSTHDKTKVFIECINGWVLIDSAVIQTILAKEVETTQASFDELDGINTLLNNTLSDALKGKQ